MLKQKLRDLLEENQALHEELKRTVVHEIIHQGDSDAVSNILYFILHLPLLNDV